jgi:hypothetical protein
MKQLFTFLFASSYFFCAYAGIKLNSAQSQVSASENIKYSFQLLDENTGSSLTEKNLVETHTKILHLVVYDSSLNEFNHVHPQFNGLTWDVSLNLKSNGYYTVWAQGKTSGGTEFSIDTQLVVVDGELENPVKSLGDIRFGVDGSTQVELAPTKLMAGKMVMMDFSISRTDGTKPILTPYLGAFAHVVATRLGGGELIHVHPMEGKDFNTGILHSTFPVQGEYRLWVQFNDQDELRTIPLSVVVQ